MITMQFVPYSDIERMDSSLRVKKILGMAKKDKIVLLQGRLTKKEEGELIIKTMEEIDEKFHGIELSVIYPENGCNGIVSRMKNGFANFMLGERQGLTIVGPASVVKEIKKNPRMIQLLTTDIKKTKKAKSKTRKRR